MLRQTSHWLKKSCLLLMLCFPVPILAHTDAHHRLEHLNEHILSEPNQAELYLRRGRLYMEQNHFALAQADFAKALALAPEQHGARYFLAEALLSTGQSAQAAEQAQQFINAHNQQARGALSQGYWLLGQAYVAQQQYEAAINAYRNALKVTDDITPDHYLLFVQACRAVGGRALNEALFVLDSALSKGGSVELLQNMAIDLELQMGRVDAALQRLDSLIAKQKGLPFLYVRQTEILLNAGRTQAAENALTAANNALNQMSETKRRQKAYQTLAGQIRALQLQANKEGVRAER